jgi:gamma-glutamyltranspeptidase/glutathione hydrolase
MKPMVAGKRGVVAAGHPLVAEAGLRILEKGGNAVDAGVATVFAASVVEMNGFGAGAECPILLKLADKPLAAINGAGIALSALRRYTMSISGVSRFQLPGEKPIRHRS